LNFAAADPAPVNVTASMLLMLPPEKSKVPAPAIRIVSVPPPPSTFRSPRFTGVETVDS